MADHPAFILKTKAVISGVDQNGTPEITEGGALLVRDGKIAAIGMASELIQQNPDLPVEDAAHSVAMPGLTNAHHHSGMTPLQMGVPFAPLEFWLPRFRGMRAVDPRLDTLYSAVEMLESGTTTVQHIAGGVFGPPDGWEASADAVIASYGEIGMRASFCFMIRDQNQLVYEDDEDFLAKLPHDLATYFRPRLKAGREPVSEMMHFFVRMKQKYAGSNPEKVRIQLAPANLHWCSDSALDEIFGTARDHEVKLHMHLDETRCQAEEARRRTGGSAVAHLARLGHLGPNLTLGHGIWCTDADLDLLADQGCCLCHNASSGLRLASGIAPVNPARKRGIRIALGIDQSGINDDRDMLQEMRVAWMLHREPGLFQDRPQTADIFKMATEHGAATTGFEGMIGRLDVGKAADIVLIDWTSVAEPYLDERTSLMDALILRAKSKSVDKVYVAGECVVKDGKVCKIDRDGLMREISAQFAHALTDAEREAQVMTDRLVPHIESWYRDYGETAGNSRYVFNQFAE